jgi:hypothetical protein
MKKGLIGAALLPLLIAIAPAHASTVVDATGVWAQNYDGPKNDDLDVTKFSANYDPGTQLFKFTAFFAGNIDTSPDGFYVIGANTGTGASHPFGGIGAPNVSFDKVILIQKNGTATIGGGPAIDPSMIKIKDNELDISVPLSALGTGTVDPLQYAFNLWPRANGTLTQPISDFAPDNGLLAVSAVPEPAAWSLLILGFGLIGGALRRRPLGKASSPAIA